MTQYTHLKDRTPYDVELTGMWDSYDMYEKLVKYDGKEVLAVQQILKYSQEPITLVPGFVENYKHKQKNGIYFSEISEIPQKLQEDVTKTLHKEGLEGKISYW
jgi:hypothetical protein